MAKKKSTGTVTELRDEIDGYQLSAVDGLDRIIAILNGWAALAASDDALQAISSSKCGPDAVHFTPKYITSDLEGIKRAIEGAEGQP